MEPAVRRSAGAVVFRRTPSGRRYLLLRNVKGHWDFPKGGVEPGESAVDAAMREAREEAGLKDLVLLPGFEQHLRWRYRERGQPVLKLTEYRLARTRAQRVRLSREHTGARWVTLAEGRMLLAFRNAWNLLRTAERWAARTAGERPDVWKERSGRSRRRGRR